LKMDMIDILDYFKKPSSMNFDCGFSVWVIVRSCRF
jgi:hypothetical protein